VQHAHRRLHPLQQALRHEGTVTEAAHQFGHAPAQPRRREPVFDLTGDRSLGLHFWAAFPLPFPILAGMQDKLPPVLAAPTAPRRMHEIDYQVRGEDLQFVEIELDPNEAVVAEAGGMMYMDDGIEMETIFGDGSQQNTGLLGSLLGAGKRLLTGESLFMTVFLNRAPGKKRLAFGAPYPGKIVPVHLAELGGEIWAQKDSFLCAAKGVSVGIAFNRKLGVGLFGGEGFIMQRLQGDGWAFMHAGGTIIERQLSLGETLRVDTGCVVAFQPTVNFDIQYVGKIKTALFGGEGLFFATLRGPGRVWLQSLPLSRLANRIYAAAPQQGGSRGEGSLLGGLGGLLDGDNQ
jgi:uncharacterized protein (TIGR00266 family)